EVIGVAFMQIGTFDSKHLRCLQAEYFPGNILFVRHRYLNACSTNSSSDHSRLLTPANNAVSSNSYRILPLIQTDPLPARDGPSPYERSCSSFRAGGPTRKSEKATRRPARSGVQHIGPTRYSRAAGKGHRRDSGQATPSDD